MKKIKLSCLSIELTRRCNLKCAHCFKGDSQNVDLSKEYIDKLFNMIDEIYTIHITGGEPSLNLKGMRYLIDAVIRNKITVYRLNIICNGETESTRDFLDMVDELNQIVLKPRDTRITVSCDPYHNVTGKISLKNLFRGYFIIKDLNKVKRSFKVLPYFTCCYPPLVAMGRGQSNQNFADPEDPDKYGILYNRPVNVHDNVIKHICIHATGLIGRDLNISYDDADKGEYQICHIDDISNSSDLISAVRKWNEKEDIKIRGTLFDIASRIYSPVCKSCPNYVKVHNQRLQLLKKLIDSEEINDYPSKFKESVFIRNLRDKTEDVDSNYSVILSDAMNCKWWEFSCWKR